jgi:putative flippase GtrA
MSERLKIVRSPVRSRPQPPYFHQILLLGMCMRTKIKDLKSKYFDWSMIRWVIVGISTTATDYFIFISLYGPIDSVVIANFISAFVATSLNYYSHHRWTFKSEQDHSKSGVRYFINLVFWWVISTLLIKGLIVIEVDPKIAKLIPILVIAPINYFVLNHLVFKKKS